jgi:DNA-binding transcriptional MerR regulator
MAARAGTITGRTYQIGEVARRVRLSLRTLRYWEEVGLIVPSGRTEGGFRVYSEDDVARVLLVRQMKAADLSIEELKGLLEVVDLLKRRDVAESDRGEASKMLVDYLVRIRQRCEILRVRIDQAEDAALGLESLLDDPDAAV